MQESGWQPGEKELKNLEYSQYPSWELNGESMRAVPKIFLPLLVCKEDGRWGISRLVSLTFHIENDGIQLKSTFGDSLPNIRQ